MNNLSVQFWGCLTIANVWIAKGDAPYHSAFWIAMAVVALIGDLLIKMRE